MSRRQWQLIALAGSILIFVVTISVIAVFVSNRRSQRDLRFGMEELDLLIEDEIWSEARAMLPWLADRTRTAGDALRVAKRARLVSEGSGDTALFAEVANTLLTEFSGNTSLREVSIYAFSLAGDYERALEQAQVLLEQTGDDLYFAWVLLNQGESLLALEASSHQTSVPDDAGSALLLATLSRESSVDEFVNAWNASGRWEYAHLAAAMAMRDGDNARAADLVETASLASLSPLLSYDIEMARGDFSGARRALGHADSGTTETLMRAADFALYTARESDAAQAYERLEESVGDRLPYQALINLSWLSGETDETDALLAEALERFPDQWDVREQAARYWSHTDPQRATAVLSGSAARDQREENQEAQLLLLRIAGDPSRRSFEAALWQLLEDDPPESIQRYAAWYFAGSGTGEDIDRVLDRSAADGAAWIGLYRGIQLAREGRWESAAQEFEKSFRSEPTAAAAFNDAIARVRTGYVTEARNRLDDAIVLSDPGSTLKVQALLARARMEPDRIAAMSYLRQARAIAPGNPQLLLLEQTLGVPSGHR